MHNPFIIPGGGPRFAKNKNFGTKTTGTVTIDVSAVDVARIKAGGDITIALSNLPPISYEAAQLIDNAAAVDAGGGITTIPLTAHGHAVGDFVKQAGTTNYNGTYEIVAKAADTYDITETYAAETFAGTETSEKYADEQETAAVTIIAEDFGDHTITWMAALDTAGGTAFTETSGGRDTFELFYPNLPLGEILGYQSGEDMQ